MAVINTMNLIAKTKVDSRYAMRTNNMEEILHNSSKDSDSYIFSLIGNAFKFGYAQGMKAERSKKEERGDE